MELIPHTTATQLANIYTSHVPKILEHLERLPRLGAVLGRVVVSASGWILYAIDSGIDWIIRCLSIEGPTQGRDSNRIRIPHFEGNHA